MSRHADCEGRDHRHGCDFPDGLPDHVIDGPHFDVNCRWCTIVMIALSNVDPGEEILVTDDPRNASWGFTPGSVVTAGEIGRAVWAQLKLEGVPR